MIRCRVFISRYRYVRFASTCTQSLTTLSTACQATRTVELLLPSIKLQAASHNSHRYIFASAIPMPLFESQAVATVHRYSHAALYFPGDLVGPDPSSAVLPSVLYFPGLMRARRLRLHRHRMSSMSYWSLRSSWTRWSSRRCSQIIISRLEELHPGPGKKDCLFLEIWIRSRSCRPGDFTAHSYLFLATAVITDAASQVVFSRMADLQLLPVSDLFVLG